MPFAPGRMIDNLFQHDERNALWLPAFRILGSLVFLLHLLAVLPDLTAFWGSDAIIRPDILDARTSKWSPTIWDFYVIVEPHSNIRYDALVRIFYFAQIFGLIFIALGFLTRFMAATTLILHLIWSFSIEIMLYGADFMTTICLFYMVVFPVGRHYSLDAYHRGDFTGNSPHQRFNLTLLQVHFGIAYFFSGLAKALGPTWWNGEAVWKALQTNNYLDFLNFNSFSNFPVIFQCIGIATVLIELTYPIGIGWQRSRNYFLAGIIIFHVSIGFLLGLYFFSTIMILINLCAFWIPYLPAKAGGAVIIGGKQYGAE